MREVVKIALTVLALGMLATSTGLLIVDTISGLPNREYRPASDQKAGQPKHDSAYNMPSMNEFSGWDLQDKAHYCTENMPDKSPAQWAQTYLCGAKHTDDIAATSSIRTVYLTVALFAIACVQARIYWKQARIMAGQQDVMASQRDISVASQRAWIATSIDIAGPVYVAGNEMSFSVSIRLTNSGDLPAYCARPDMNFYPWGAITGVTDEGINERWIRHRPKLVGSKMVIFPQQSVTTQRQGGIRISDINPNSKVRGQTRDSVAISVRGAIWYSYPGNDEVHHTTFHAHIVRKGVSEAPAMWRQIPARDGVLRIEELTITTDLAGETEAT